MDENMQDSAEMSEREALLYTLFKRCIFRNVRPDIQRVLVGQIPTDLPEKIPLPEGCRVVGTIIDWLQSSIILDSALAPDAVIAFYKEQLSTSGWQEQEQLLMATLLEKRVSVPPAKISSFERGGNGEKQQGFLRTVHGPLLTVTAEAGLEESTQIEIVLNVRVDDYVQGYLDKYVPLPSQSHLPALHPPGDGEESSGSHSISDYDAHRFSIIQFTSAMELPQLLEHYHTQLVQAGWQLSMSEQNDPVAWSTWTAQDKERASWSGGLTLQRIGSKPVYALTLYLRRDSIKRPEGAWFSWGNPPVFDEE